MGIRGNRQGRELRRSYEVGLRSAAPFRFVGTVHKPGHFPGNGRVWQFASL